MFHGVDVLGIKSGMLVVEIGRLAVGGTHAGDYV